MNKTINSDLKKYIKENILPEYEYFDEGHGRKHIEDVKNRSLEYYEELTANGVELNINMVYTVACYHDLGMKIERKNHALHSGELVRLDDNLKKWFSENEIEEMAQAVSDHSTSTGHMPRNIYGMIVSDADKDRDMKTAIIRSTKFCLKTKPNLTLAQIGEDIHKEIIKRFGKKEDGGEELVKFYISSKANQEFLNQMEYYVHNKEDFMKLYFEVIAEEMQKNENFGHTPNK